MSISLRHLISIGGLMADRLVVAVGESYICADEANPGLLPCGTTPLDLGPFEHSGHERQYLRASFISDAESVRPDGIAGVVSLQNGSIKIAPSLLPVANNRPDCRFIFSRAKLFRPC